MLDRAIKFPIGRKTPDDVRRDNRDRIAGALNKAQVPFFVVRKDTGTRTAVGVAPENHKAAVEALTEGLSDEGFYCLLISESNNAPMPILLATADQQSMTRAAVVRLWRFFAVPGGKLSYGRQYACDVEFWTDSSEHRGHLSAPEPNAVSSSVPRVELDALVDDPRSGWPIPSVFLRKTPGDFDFKIDVVYTWVDDSDPKWQARKAKAAGENDGGHHHIATSEERFRNRDELRYSLRSLDMYAPWVNHVYLVTDNQIPEFLTGDEEDLTVIDHRDIAPPAAQLPVFNSNAIICWLHHIPELEEHYLFLNDDMFFGRDVRPELFFSPSGLARAFPSRNRRPLGESNSGDEPHVNISRNIRSIIEREFGCTISRAIKHTPYPQLKSVNEELEERFRTEYERTSRSRFRHHTDIVADQLFHYYAQMQGKAIEGQIRYTYVNVGDRAYLPDLDELIERRHRDVFCLNDAPQPGVQRISDRQIIKFLDRYFPVPSRWEHVP